MSIKVKACVLLVMLAAIFSGLSVVNLYKQTVYADSLPEIETEVEKEPISYATKPQNKQAHTTVTTMKLMKLDIDFVYPILSSTKEPDMSGIIYTSEKLGKYYITAYCNCSKCCGKWANGKTASGTTCHTGNITTCAVDPRVIPMGTIIEVDGKLYRAEDTGSAVKGNHIDIYLTDHKQVQKFNSHYSTIYKVSFPFGKPDDQ